MRSDAHDLVFAVDVVGRLTYDLVCCKCRISCEEVSYIDDNIQNQSHLARAVGYDVVLDMVNRTVSQVRFFGL